MNATPDKSKLIIVLRGEEGSVYEVIGDGRKLELVSEPGLNGSECCRKDQVEESYGCSKISCEW